MKQAHKSNVEWLHMENNGMLNWKCFYKSLAHINGELCESFLISMLDVQSSTASKVVAFKCLHTNVELVNNTQNWIH